MTEGRMTEGRVDQGRGTEGTPIPPSPLRVPRRDLPLPTGGGGRALLRWLVGVHGWAIAIGMLAGIAWMGALAGVPVLMRSDRPCGRGGATWAP